VDLNNDLRIASILTISGDVPQFSRMPSYHAQVQLSPVVYL
jgi:hypothetical protein